ncbi:hypothetical protein LTR37_021496, partial [Vermiconidia calcicola]
QNDEAFEATWTRCFAILKYYEHQITSAPFAAQVLEALRRQIQVPQDQGAPALPTNFAFASLFATPIGDGTTTPQIPLEDGVHLDFSQFNPYGTDDISDAWFSQHVSNFEI